MYNLRVTLFGSTEADVTTVTDQFIGCGNSNGGPFAVAEGKAVALAAELRYPSCSPCSCSCDPCGCDHPNTGDAALGAPIAVNVTIGLFTIVKLFRTVNMVVNSLGRCLPETCTSLASTGDPCANFENIRFPLDIFSPSTEPKSCCGFGPIFGSPNCNVDSITDSNCNNSCSCGNNCGCR